MGVLSFTCLVLLSGEYGLSGIELQTKNLSFTEISVHVGLSGSS